MVKFALVTRPECQCRKGAKDEFKRPKGLQLKGRPGKYHHYHNFLTGFNNKWAIMIIIIIRDMIIKVIIIIIFHNIIIIINMITCLQLPASSGQGRICEVSGQFCKILTIITMMMRRRTRRMWRLTAIKIRLIFLGSECDTISF